MRKRAAKLKELAVHTELHAFAQRTLEVDEAQTWQLVAMACEHLGALGTYDFPTRSARLYVAIDGLGAADALKPGGSSVVDAAP